MYTLYRSSGAFYECLITVVITPRTTAVQKKILYYPQAFQNVSSKAQVKIYQICDFMISISTWDSVHFRTYLLNRRSLNHQTWPIDINKDNIFQESLKQFGGLGLSSRAFFQGYFIAENSFVAEVTFNFN